MKRLNLVWLVLILTLVSCEPQSKEAYLEKYKAFISNVSLEYETYAEADWERSLEMYERLSGDWYRKYKDDFTWKEQLLVGKYEIQYNMMRVKESSVNFFDTFMKNDFEKLKGQVLHYYENDMNEDIEFLVQQATEIGDSAIVIMQKIMEELEIEMDELFE